MRKRIMQTISHMEGDGGMGVEPFYINTCTGCRAVYMNCRRENICSRCGGYAISETCVQRDIRLGITKDNKYSYKINDQLKGTNWEKQLV